MTMMYLKSRVNVPACSKALFFTQHGFFPALKADKHLGVLVQIYFYVEETSFIVKGDTLRQMLMRHERIRKEWVIQLKNNLDFFFYSVHNLDSM